MLWNKILQLILGGSALVPQVAPPVRVGLEELLSYECAKTITTIVSSTEQRGPLFSAGHLIFTSLEAQDASLILLVNAGGGDFTIPLMGNAVNRLRFELPLADGHGQIFFLSYLHDPLRPRYFEFSEGRPPLGRDETDYAREIPWRSESLVPHLDFAIQQTVSLTLLAFIEGRSNINNLLVHNMENCDHLMRPSTSLAKNMRFSLDQLAALVRRLPVAQEGLTSTGRMPASVATALPPGAFAGKNGQVPPLPRTNGKVFAN